MTGKQRAKLRALANPLEPILYIGKEGIIPGTIKQASDDLEAHELIKCCVQPLCPLSAREALTALCEELGAEPIACIGRRFVLYRPSEKNPRITVE